MWVYECDIELSYARDYFRWPGYTDKSLVYGEKGECAFRHANARMGPEAEKIWELHDIRQDLEAIA